MTDQSSPTAAVDPWVLASWREGRELLDAVQVGTWWGGLPADPTVPRSTIALAEKAGSLRPTWSGEEPALLWERPAGGALSQAPGRRRQYRPSLEAGSHFTPQARDLGSRPRPESSSPQESGKGHEEGIETAWGPVALKPQEWQVSVARQSTCQCHANDPCWPTLVPAQGVLAGSLFGSPGTPERPCRLWGLWALGSHLCCSLPPSDCARFPGKCFGCHTELSLGATGKDHYPHLHMAPMGLD